MFLFYPPPPPLSLSPFHSFLSFSISKCGRFTSGCVPRVHASRITWSQCTPHHRATIAPPPPPPSSKLGRKKPPFPSFYSPIYAVSLFPFVYCLMRSFVRSVISFFHSKWIKWRRLQASSYWHQHQTQKAQLFFFIKNKMRRGERKNTNSTAFQLDRFPHPLPPFRFRYRRRHEYASSRSDGW